MKLKTGRGLLLVSFLAFMMLGGNVVPAAEAEIDHAEIREPAGPGNRPLAQSASSPTDGRAGKASSSDRESVAVKLLDLELVDQDGNKVKFKSDVVGDRIAVIIPFANMAEIEGVPLVGPLTLFTEDVSALNRFTFYLFSGLREQMRALVKYAREKLVNADERIAIVYPEGEIPADIVEAIAEQWGKQWENSIDKVSFPPGGPDAASLAAQLSRKGTAAVFFLGSGQQLQSLLSAAERVDWAPDVFLSGSHAGKDILDAPRVFGRKVFLAYPILPSDQREAGMREFTHLLEKYELPRIQLAAQISAYCAAKLVVEGLKRAGKNVSREKFVTPLEKLYDFDTGLTPRVTYDRNRRIGALRAHIVTVDLEIKDFVPVGKWVSLE